jgi:hypothetical protein
LLLSSERDEGEGEAHFRVEFVASDSYETNVTTMDTPAQNEECLLRWVNKIVMMDVPEMLGYTGGWVVVSPRNWKKANKVKVRVPGTRVVPGSW